VASIRQGGGPSDWIYKKAAGKSSAAALEFVVENRAGVSNHRFPEILYRIAFAEEGQRFAIVDEKITSTEPEKGQKERYIFSDYNSGNPVLNVSDAGLHRLSHDDISPEQSILFQRRDPDSYPEITSLAKELERIKLYRNWPFGCGSCMRNPAQVDAPNDFLEENGTNLPLILNRLDFLGKKPVILDELRKFYHDAADFLIKLEGRTAQLFFREKEADVLIPAPRLSDGTFRYLFLLCILLHPSPPPVVCIEEPELGLHPDILPTVAELLQAASEHCQLIVTTHSPALIDALTDHPECVLVAEKDGDGTTLTRLSENELKPWLEKYRLGELWIRGDIGGNIW
jgi:predicted ATPase